MFIGLREAVLQRLGRADLTGLRVAVQGLGQVGFNLAQQLRAAGAELWVHDIQEANVRRAVDELGAHAVGAQDIYGLDVDVFSPCAMGAIINDETLQLLQAPVIAGAANNQLAKASHADVLWRRGCLHAPDYAINAGGIIDVSYEYTGVRLNRYVGTSKALVTPCVRSSCEPKLRIATLLILPTASLRSA